jgi:Protein of unknown function (DUF1393).
MTTTSNFNLRTLTTVSLLISAQIVLTRFLSISLPFVRISLVFVPIAICGLMHGPVWSGLSAAMADFIGFILFSSGNGPFFPGFTLSMALTGIVFGFFLTQKKDIWLNTIIAVLINCLFISLVLNTYWVSILTNTNILVLMPQRILQNIFMIPVQITVLMSIRNPIIRILRQFDYQQTN